MRKKGAREHTALGQNIALKRKAMGWTQDDLAEYSGVSISAVKDIERGVAEGHYTSRKALAKALRCSLAALYEDGEANDPAPILDFSQAASFLARFQSLSSLRKAMVLALVFDDVGQMDGLPQNLTHVASVLIKESKR